MHFEVRKLIENGYVKMAQEKLGVNEEYVVDFYEEDGINGRTEIFKPSVF